MAINYLTSKNNELINELAKLKDKTERINKGEFIVEGLHLVNEAYKHHKLLKVLATNEETLKEYSNVESFLVSEVIIKKLSSTLNPQGIVGIASIDDNNYDNLGNKLIILDEVSDPGNLGTIIRSAAALGYDSVIAVNNCVDYYNDKTVRASQGAIFKINLLKDTVSIINELKNNGYKMVGTSLKDSVNIKKLPPLEKLAIVLGNEAHGVSSDVLNRCDYKIILPMHNDVESLNVAVAGSIIMWELNK